MDREGEYPGLKKLYVKAFGEEIQKGTHDPVGLHSRSWTFSISPHSLLENVFADTLLQVEDARAAMRLFLSVREEYERSLARGEECVSGLPA